jgi:hypothetical protein
LLDLFIYPDGLELRDRVSHAEINRADLNKDDATRILSITLFLYTRVWESSEPCSSFTIATNTLWKNPEGYQECIYHPYASSKASIVTLLLCISIIKTRWQESSLSELLLAERISTIIAVSSQEIQFFCDPQHFDLKTLIHKMPLINHLIVWDSARRNLALLLYQVGLRNIEVIDTLYKYEDQNDDRMMKRQLTSRQRENWCRFKELRPLYYQRFVFVAGTCFKIFGTLIEITDVDVLLSMKHHLIRMLTCVERCLSYSREHQWNKGFISLDHLFK